MPRIYDGKTYRDMTAEELAAWEKEKANANPEPTPEERIAALETATDDMILLMAELIGGN